MRRAKIVCTLGPAVESIEKITELIDAGMNMARLNLSHGSHDEHQKRLDLVRAAAKKANKAVAILVDLQGPKIRLGKFSSGPHELSRGDTFTITTDENIPLGAPVAFDGKLVLNKNFGAGYVYDLIMENGKMK